jgi:hypothetical protein
MEGAIEILNRGINGRAKDRQKQSQGQAQHSECRAPGTPGLALAVSAASFATSRSTHSVAGARTAISRGGITGSRPRDLRARVDVVVVYFICSASDFGTAVQIFDAKACRSPRRTPFEYPTSMGWLDAKYRIHLCPARAPFNRRASREGMAASNKKAMWIGSMRPLCYAVRDAKLIT